jgi:hypothetical protein
MAEAPTSLDVVAFVQMHGAVEPTKLESSLSGQTPGCWQYELTGRPLPEKTTLYAPKILGKSYHATNTSKFISRLSEEWNKPPLPGVSLPYVSFPVFCLSKVKEFEKDQVSSMEQEMEDSDFLQIMEAGYTKERKERRLVLEGAIVQKSEIKWDEHEYSIAEKSYYVVARDSIQNCIMFFCNDIEPRKTLHPLRVNTSTKLVDVRVSYTKRTKLFKITFDDTQNHVFSFEDLNTIVRVVLISDNMIVRRVVTSHEIKLTIFDFTCCVALFPENDECLTPQLLSSTMLSNSGDSHPKLIYGTNRTADIQHDLELNAGRLNAADVYAGPVSDNDSFTQQSLSEFQSQSTTSLSPSPPKPPTHVIVVNLMGGVASFADFQPISTRAARSRSVSPAKGSDGGRSRKKAHRKRITRRRRHTNRRLRTKSSIRRT